MDLKLLVSSLLSFSSLFLFFFSGGEGRAEVRGKEIGSKKKKVLIIISIILEFFESDLGDKGVDLKKLAKMFASKFATGSSVTKNNQGEDEIVIQGDVSDEVSLFSLSLFFFFMTKHSILDLVYLFEVIIPPPLLKNKEKKKLT